MEGERRRSWQLMQRNHVSMLPWSELDVIPMHYYYISLEEAMVMSVHQLLPSQHHQMNAVLPAEVSPDTPDSLEYSSTMRRTTMMMMVLPMMMLPGPMMNGIDVQFFPATIDGVD